MCIWSTAHYITKKGLPLQYDVPFLVYKPSCLYYSLTGYVSDVAVSSTPRILHSSAQTISPQYPSFTYVEKIYMASSIWFILAKLLNKSCLLGFHATLPNDTTATWCPTAKTQSLWHIHTYLTSFKPISSKHKVTFFPRKWKEKINLWSYWRGDIRVEGDGTMSWASTVGNMLVPTFQTEGRLSMICTHHFLW